MACTRVCAADRTLEQSESGQVIPLTQLAPVRGPAELCVFMDDVFSFQTRIPCKMGITLCQPLYPEVHSSLPLCMQLGRVKARSLIVSWRSVRCGSCRSSRVKDTRLHAAGLCWVILGHLPTFSESQFAQPSLAGVWPYGAAGCPQG